MKLEIQLAQPILPCAAAGGHAEVVFLVRLLPDAAGPAAPRPVDLRFVLDRSWSMRDPSGLGQDSKLDVLKGACVAALDQLRLGSDRVGAWAFSGQHACVFESKGLKSAAALARAKDQIQGLTLGKTGTVFSGALAAASQRPRDVDAAGLVVLVTDGMPACGDIPAEREHTLALAERVAERGLTLLVFGTGVEYDEAFMRQVAERAGAGSMYAHVSRLDALAEELGRELELGGHAEATDVELALRPAAGAALVEVIAMLPAQHDVTVAADGSARERAGTLDARGRAYVVRARVPAAAPGARSVATAEVVWRQAGRPERARREVLVELTGDATRVAPVDPVVQATLLSAAGARATLKGDLGLARTLYGSAGNATMLGALASLGTAASRGDEDAGRALRTRVLSGLPSALATAREGK